MEKHAYRIKGKNYTTVHRLVHVYDASSFRRVLRGIERETLRVVSNAHISLTYGDSIEGIWEGYRADIDSGIPKLGLSQHLAAIEENIVSANPEQWRAAMYACRSVLEDLANYLWRDPTPSYAAYTHNGKPLGVTAAQYINRLYAYLHCKGVHGHTAAQIQAQLDRLGALLHTLNDLDSKAHRTVSHNDARLSVIETYVVIGEFVRRTDLEPVVDQTACH